VTNPRGGNVYELTRYAPGRVDAIEKIAGTAVFTNRVLHGMIEGGDPLVQELTGRAEPLVGRDGELEAIYRAFESLGEGPFAVLVEGEAGIGKTRVWQEALRRAGAHGYRLFTCRPVESEVELGFAALSDLLGESLDDISQRLPGPQRRALEVAFLRADPGEQPVDQRAVAAGLLSSLRHLASAQPIIVAVDDVQWLDESSRAVLQFAVRRLRDESIGLMLTRRSSEEAEAPLALESTFVGERLLRLRLRPLSLGALQRLLRTSLALALSRPVLQRVEEASGGNPFFALEVGRALAEQGGRLGDDGELPVSRRLDELLHDRLSELAPEAREILALAALSANPTVSVLERGLGYDVERALAPARRSAVVAVEHGRIRFSHPLIASTCLAHVDEDRRRELHRRLAETVDSSEERARHLALASEQPDPELASLLEEGADALRHRGAAAAAAELLEHARRLTPAAERAAWARRSTTLADLLYHSGDEGGGLRVADEVIEHSDPGPDRALALALSSVYVAARVGRFEQARGEAGDDPALQARIGLMEAATRGHAGDWRGRTACLEEALAAARRAGDGELIVQTLTLAAWTAIAVEDEKDSRQRAREDLLEALRIEQTLPVAARTRATWAPKTKLGIYAMYAEELGEARRLFAEQCARAAEGGDDWSLNGLLAFAAEVERRAGDLSRARELAIEAYEIAERNVDAQGRALALAHLASIQAMLGPLDEARATAARASAAAAEIGERIYGAQARMAAGLIASCLGDHNEVLREVGTLPEELESFGRREIESPLAAAIGEEIEARVAVGDLESARRRIDDLEVRSRRLDRPRQLGAALRGRGLLFAAEAHMEDAFRALASSLIALECIQAPFERARTLLALGTVQRRAKQRRAARQSLQAAVAIFEELGATPWAKKASTELGRVGGRVPGGEELSPTERRVAELVAEGRTNREVAAALFVTPRTVEWNLTKIYSKLGVRSRAELAHTLPRRLSVNP
jgi:DNA-binding CsgD family transcriptional regulator